MNHRRYFMEQGSQKAALFSTSAFVRRTITFACLWRCGPLNPSASALIAMQSFLVRLSCLLSLLICSGGQTLSAPVAGVQKSASANFVLDDVQGEVDVSIGGADWSRGVRGPIFLPRVAGRKGRH